MGVLNCKNCLYANELDNESVMCDKVLLLYGKEVYIEKVNADKPCPAHSSCFIEETRAYFTNKDMRKAEDACEVCGRLVNLQDTSQYGYTIAQNELGKSIEKLQCRICSDKGRE